MSAEQSPLQYCRISNDDPWFGVASCADRPHPGIAAEPALCDSLPFSGSTEDVGTLP